MTSDDEPVDRLEEVTDKRKAELDAMLRRVFGMD